MRRALSLIAAVALAGCSQEDDALPVACVADEAAVVAALAAAPAALRVNGWRISTCVRRARSDGDLQSLGVLYTGAAEELGARARDERDPDLARRLGYLVGAVRRGAGSTLLQADLARRVGMVTLKLRAAPAAVRTALDEGLRAGEARG